ncbi:MAG: hypothetical protein ACI9IT_002483, partial [Glaciecola sp.]
MNLNEYVNVIYLSKLFVSVIVTWQSMLA